MGMLIIGLVLFLGIHTVSIVAPQWREGQIARLGEGPWKGIYSVVSAIGFGLLDLRLRRRAPETRSCCTRRRPRCATSRCC